VRDLKTHSADSLVIVRYVPEARAKGLRPSRPQEVSPSFASLQDGADAPPFGWVIPLLLRLLPPCLAGRAGLHSMQPKTTFPAANRVDMARPPNGRKE
jgi:hypothetical protein